MFDYEWAAAQHHVNCRLANRVLVPDAIPAERLARYGARRRKLVRYPGLKEEYYLSDFEPDRGGARRSSAPSARRSLCVVRTAPSYALYLGGSENAAAAAPAAPRSPADERVRPSCSRARPSSAPTCARSASSAWSSPSATVDGRSLVALADVLVSAGGTMNREAAVLGTPVWSMFEGKLGAVDEQLVREGRLRLLRDAGELGSSPSPPAHAPTACAAIRPSCSSSRCQASAQRGRWLGAALQGLLDRLLALAPRVVLARSARSRARAGAAALRISSV